MNRGSSSSNGNVNHEISTNNKNALVDDDFVVIEILSRLPVKSLMKFKSVCKHWRSSIQHDSQFHQLHYNHSKIRRLGFYIVTQIRCDDNRNHAVAAHRLYISSQPKRMGIMVGHREYFFSAAAKGGAATLDTFLVRKKLSYRNILRPVNGLVCLVWSGGGDHAVCIYNPSTREETQWIETTFRRSRSGKDGIMLPTFVFGFDHVTKKHKLFCHWILDWQSHKYACEVFTVGDNSWRRIEQDQVPPYNYLYGPRIHVNGAIYWMNGTFHRHNEECDGAPQVLVVFDLGTDKYRLIPIPDFIINQPRESREPNDGLGRTLDLLEVDGRVAILQRRNRNTVSVWILLFDYDDHNHRMNWTEVIITLPFDWAVGKATRVCFHNVPGTTDQILLEAYVDDVLSAYYYNWKKNAFTKEVEFSGIATPACSLFTPFAESLSPVS